jgi:fumarylacetoacetase
MGVFLSKPLPRGERLAPTEAKEHIFGFVLLNDWSSRNIQVFEMPPLGPFHGKGFGTSISPWIITMEALELVESGQRDIQDPAPLSHLAWNGDKRQATFDIEVSVKVIRK